MLPRPLRYLIAVSRTLAYMYRDILLYAFHMPLAWRLPCVFQLLLPRAGTTQHVLQSGLSAFRTALGWFGSREMLDIKDLTRSLGYILSDDMKAGRKLL